MTGGKAVALRLDPTADDVEWFPGQLQNILGDVFSNALRCRDPEKDESWVLVSVRSTGRDYEFRVFDHGKGCPGAGLAVVRLLVRQCGGTSHARSEDGGGTELIITLPRFEMDDFLT